MSVAIVLVMALGVLVFPVPSDHLTLGTLWRIPLGHAADNQKWTVLAGNSVVTHISRCDSDHRTLAEMVGANARIPVVDLSYGGEQLAETINFAATALRAGSASDVVLFLATFELTSKATLDAHTQAFFRMAAGPFSGNDLWPRLTGLQGFATPPALQQTPFTYGNTSYPDYGTIARDYFSIENEHENCPEAGGYNDAAIEAFYWNMYLRNGLQPGYIDDLQRLRELADARHARLHIILMPIDYADIRRRNPRQADDVAAAAQTILAALRDIGVDPLDLTDTQPAEAFSDRYCACGHLQQAGRLAVAARTAQLLK